MKYVISLLLIAGLLTACSPKELEYQFFEGPIFGTSFSITYKYKEDHNLDKGIMELMNEFSSSMSTYDTNSIISRFNRNDPDVTADNYFTTCFNRAVEISKASDGAFDMTVAPLVNMWGFGFTKKDSVYPELIEELLSITGYEKVKLKHGRLIKENPGIMLDASALAKGQGVDVVSEYFESLGIENYLVEIGGELRCKGLSPSDTLWRVGVDKPVENMMQREFQAILTLTNISMATSGNYRQYYEKDGIKYSHTIDPKSGYPVSHSLLSATVLAPDCMTADAYATAFMVMGYKKAKKMVQDDKNLEAYLIFSNDNGEMLTWVSEGMVNSVSQN